MLERIIKTIFSLIIVLAVIVSTVLLFKMDDFIKSAIEIKGAIILQAPVGVGKVDVNLIKGTIEAFNLVVYNPQGYTTPYFLQTAKITVYINFLSIFTDKIKISNITFDSSRMHIESNKMGNNYAQILQNVSEYKSLETHNDLSSPRTSLQKVIKRTIQIDKTELNNLELHTKTGVIETRNEIKQIQVNDIGKNEDVKFAHALYDFLERLYQETIKANMKSADIDVTNTLKNVKRNVKRALAKTAQDIDKMLNE
jgi:hypothetical protein